MRIESPPIIRKLNAVDEELTKLKAERDALKPAPIELPTDLPALYRAYVADLVGTLSDEAVAGPAADELHTLIDSVTVTWNESARVHGLEIRGKLLEMLAKAKPAGRAGFDANASSLKLVAGARIGHCFIPANFGGKNFSPL